MLIAVASELRELLSLQDCRFVREQPSGKGAWIANDGTVRLNPLRWPSSTAGLPTKQVELPVRGGGTGARDVHPDADSGRADQPGTVHRRRRPRRPARRHARRARGQLNLSRGLVSAPLRRGRFRVLIWRITCDSPALSCAGLCSTAPSPWPGWAAMPDPLPKLGAVPAHCTRQ